MFPSTEQIAEVKVTSELATAEYGQVGDVTFVTKGGTNQYHGSLFEYFQNDALDATPDFANGKPKKRDNTFGGSFSGPVWIPKIYNGKDRTFFFFDWEGNRQHSAAPVTNNVPTAAMRGGRFLQSLRLIRFGRKLYQCGRHTTSQSADWHAIPWKSDPDEPDQSRFAEGPQHVLSPSQPAERQCPEHEQQLQHQRSSARHG